MLVSCILLLQQAYISEAHLGCSLSSSTSPVILFQYLCLSLSCFLPLHFEFEGELLQLLKLCI